MNSLYTAEGVMDKHSLWQRYVPLVRHEALRLQVRLPASVELDDLLQAGGIGLLNAVDRYDALQGTAFTTYAVQRIRGAMLDELRSRAGEAYGRLRAAEKAAELRPDQLAKVADRLAITLNPDGRFSDDYRAAQRGFDDVGVAGIGALHMHLLAFAAAGHDLVQVQPPVVRCLDLELFCHR